METALPISACKRKLAQIWFTGGGILFFIVAVQSMLGRYGEVVSQAWGWLLPTVLPTLSLIIGQLVFDAVQGTPSDKKMDRFLFQLTAALSLAYLLAVILVILVKPFQTDNPDPIQQMQLANVWLGPLQGLVAAAMGAFFVKAARDGHDTEAAAATGQRREG